MYPNDFEGHSAIKIDTETKKLFEEMKKDRKRYYEKLSTSRFGLALPGLGYDCFRCEICENISFLMTNCLVVKNMGTADYGYNSCH
jgi:hypothetical protein